VIVEAQSDESENYVKFDSHTTEPASINIETLMGHSIRISDSYYRATAPELLEDYLKAVPSLSVSIETEILL
jgi:hypothetical protein